MVIFILDYASMRCLKVRPMTLISDAPEAVELWLRGHEDELGISVDDCHFMVTDYEKVASFTQDYWREKAR